MSSNIEDEEAEKFLQSMIFTKNLRVENKRFLLLGRPGILFDTDIFVSLFKPLIDYNPKILQDAGFMALEGVMSDYSKRFDNVNDILNFIKKASPFYGAGGMDFNLQKDKVIVTLNPSVLAESYVRLFGKSDKPVCYFTIGLLNRLFKSILKKDVSFEEVSCVAKGDTTCTFIASI